MKKPNHIPLNYDSFLLIKFFKESQWRDEFIDGKFYMNTVGIIQQYFENYDGKQYDIYDGTQTFLRTTGDSHLSFLPDEKGEYWIVQKPGMPTDNQFVAEAALGRNMESEKKLFCMYTLWGDSIKKEFRKIDSSIIKDFGKYAAVLINTPLFIKRVQEKANLIRSQMNSEPLYDFVDYFHKENLPAITPLGLYRKIQADSVHQNEFRICFDMKDVTGAYKDFKIQNSDICVAFETEKLINMSKVDITGLRFGRL